MQTAATADSSPSFKADATMRVSPAFTALLVFGSASIGSFSIANAQGVQQPVVGTTAVGTSVSVPDRGRINLGGVQRGAAGRVSTGPLRSGTNSGRSLQSGSMSATVWIHDHQEMDRQLLSHPVERDAGARLSPKAEHAARSLSQTTPADARQDRENNTPAGDASEASRYLKRGQEAAAAGKVEVAKVYLRLAVDRGSTEAALELRRLPQPVSPTPVTRAPSR